MHSIPDRTATTTRPIHPGQPDSRQAVHPATDCFPVTNEGERHFGATVNSCRRKTKICPVMSIVMM